MAASGKRNNLAPRISNRQALHEFFIEAKLECGIALTGTEVKSLRNGRGNLQEAYAKIENGELYLFQAHIDPYDNASHYNHLPTRDRKLLVHRRELRRLEKETAIKGVTLIPLALYFKEGIVKVEIGVARHKQQHDKRDTIRKKEMERDVRRQMTKRT